MNFPGTPSRTAAAAFLAALVVTSAAGADWPDWRGPKRDGWTTETLPTRLPANPSVRWKKSVGHGYSGVVISGDRLILADETGGQETLHALQLADGKELWSLPVAPVWNDEFENGPRCTPVVADGRIFFQSNQGEFVAVNAATGQRLWGFQFKTYGAFWVPSPNSGVGAANRRGNAGSPLVHGDQVVVQVGSTNNASLCAFNTKDGRLLWRSQNDLTCFTSPMIATLDGVEQVVTATCEGLLGVAWNDGRKLWRVPFRTGANRNVLTPLVDEGTITFASHTTGMRRVRVAGSGATQEATDQWFNTQLRINLSTPVRVGGHYYGLGPARNFICVDRTTGAVTWTETGFEAAAATLTDGHTLLVLLDTGEVRLLAATPEKYTELGRFQASGKTMSHPAWADGRLYVRDSRELQVYEFGH